jgi:hypothetical protein
MASALAVLPASVPMVVWPGASVVVALRGLRNPRERGESAASLAMQAHLQLQFAVVQLQLVLVVEPALVLVLLVVWPRSLRAARGSGLAWLKRLRLDQALALVVSRRDPGTVACPAAMVVVLAVVCGSHETDAHWARKQCADRGPQRALMGTRARSNRV